MTKHRKRQTLVIEIALRPGVCRWCGCTYDNPCPPGCGWANREETLCTECVDLDKKIRSRAGRAEVADAFHIGLEAQA